jgi:glycerophosphoryl diester phosphodiesterase
VAAVQTLRIAHRGDSRAAPENSIAALLAAMDVPGCDGVEFDVRASVDGVPVLLHDETLARVQGRREAVGALTADELETLGIPRLDDVLVALPRRAFLDIELKETFGRELIEIVAAGRGPDLQNAVVSSFYPDTLTRIHDLAPGWPCWLNARSLSASTIGQATQLGCVGISAIAPAVTARAFRAARTAGLEVAAWTVTRRATYRRLADLGAVAICVEGDALTG